MKGNYLHNFTQAVFNALPPSQFRGGTLLVSGDGRYFSRQAIQIICEIAFGNAVKRVWIGGGGLVSTPAGSAIIREREGGKAFGGFLLTASHNPGGLNEDFGVKYNSENGGPAPESLTDKIYENTKIIKEYKTVKIPAINIDEVGLQKFLGDQFIVEVIDPIEDWLKVIKGVFDFGSIKNLLDRQDFSMVYDGMHGVAGPYARRIFVEELKVSEKCLINCSPKEDFGGGHPDPNLTYAKDLVHIMKPLQPDKADDTTPVFGAAGDGDCDRNMILGKGCFVTPSDSLAIIAAYACDCIPYFQKKGMKGLARSMPTAAAVDLVAQVKGIKVYETPTGWKYFGNLMDAGQLSLCGEESFGTGSDHIREKDGLWAVLAWLSILAHENKNPNAPFVHVKDILHKFWSQFGRFFYCRYDYEGVDMAAADKLMDKLRECISDLKGMEVEGVDKTRIREATEFRYVDPVDNSITEKQGIIFYLNDKSRIIWRLSGTGSSGATIRLYLEKYDKSPFIFEATPMSVLDEIGKFAVALGQIEKFTGRKKPTVIT